MIREAAPPERRCGLVFATMKRLISLLFLLALPALAAEEVKIDSAAFGGLRARSIGPAVMGGRIAALDATADSPATIYVGSAGGGIWKSTDGGITFKPVFDEHPQSIGAIAIDRSNPQTVWAGTGESWMRNSVSVGKGVYKTTDGGATWQPMGLDASEHIARIGIDPHRSDTVFVCAAGHAWNANEERGVFKTSDGGKTWKKVLYVDANTGCSDLSIDPQDPSIVFAGMWQFRRQPDFFTSGGPGSGLYRSTDGGEHWQRLSSGLPAGNLGRIAVAVAPSRPSVVYALVESKQTALYRSDDVGEHWRAVNDSFNVTGRPFYFAALTVDPTDFNRVYKPGFGFTFSTDGGKTFSASMTAQGAVHGDYHAAWVNPKDPAHLLVGTDGGLYESRDRAQHWRFLDVLPVSQFYHVTFDMDRPYNVYGGLQDNGTWTAPSSAPGGVANRHWRNLGGGDGFSVATDPTDPDIVYVESQGGHIVRVRRSTGESKDVFPYARGEESKLRFNWNTPIVASAVHKGTIYMGAQLLLRSSDRGDSWERISPDLTTNDQSRQKQLDSGGLTVDNSSAENYTTIVTIAESSKAGGTLWVGTDDGNLQVTRDGGKSWTNVAPNLRVPARTWVTSVEASHFDADTAYVTLDGHRTGDMKPYVYRTTDGGKSWEALASPAVTGYAHVIREDLVNPKLLFLGTEAGLWVSLDGGKNWAQLKEQFPPVAVNDIAIHPREADVLIATHGRGIYILDDITPLRALDETALAKDVVMLPSRPSWLTIPSGEQRSEGDASFSAGETSDVASISYYLRKRHVVGDSRVEVYDAAGKKVATLPAGKRRGINRVDWPMRLKAPKLPAANALVMSGGAMVGPRIPAGTYTVKLIKGEETYTSTVEIAPDPRASYPAANRALQQQTVQRLYDMLGDFTFLVERVRSLRDQATAKKLTSLARRLDDEYKTLVATREGGFLSGEEQLRERLGMVYGAVNSYDGRPTGSQLDEMETLSRQLAKKSAWFDTIAKEAARSGLTPLTREEWDRSAGPVN